MSSNKSKQTKPAFWIPPAYFAMGFPFVFIAQASAIMYKNMGISDTQITFWTGLLILPWTLKPLWSPILEMFKSKKYFVIGSQFITAVTFALVALSLPLNSFFTYSIALLGVVAFSGATNDIATDGIYLDVLKPKLQAEFIGWQGASYNIAKIIAAGPLVYLAGVLEEQMGVVNAWVSTMFAFGIVMLILALYHIRMLPKGNRLNTEVQSLQDGLNTFKDVFKTFFQKKKVYWFIAFIILYRFAEGFAIKLAPMFSIAETSVGGLGLSTKEYSIIYGTAGAAAFVAGSILGGYFTAKRGLKRSRMFLVACFNIPFAVYTYLAFAQPESFYLIGTAVVLEYFGYGFGFVGLMLFMMQQVAPGKYKMAHYAFATGIMNLGVMIPSMMSGFISDIVGYKIFFVWVLIATIPAFLATYFVPYVHPDNKEQKEIDNSTTD